MPKAKQLRLASEMSRVGKFGAVGLLNTVLDFTILNVLVLTLGVPRIPANVVSTTMAMIISFFLNKRVVFQARDGAWIRQVVAFFAVTAFGLYVLQNGVIALLTMVWPAPLQLAVTGVHAVGLGRVLSDRFVILNGAKVVGTAVSLTWNYVVYKRVVFR